MAENTQEQQDETYEDDLAADIEKAFAEVEAKAGSEGGESGAQSQAETTQQDEPQSQDKDAGPARDEHGRFKAKDDKPAEGEQNDAEKAPASEATDAGKPPESEAKPAAAPTASGPPPSWSIKAKAAWDTLPEDVRAEIAKRETEVSQGFSSLREFKELKPFADMAAQQGTTLPRVLQHYTQTIAPLERMLRQDLGTGLAVIAQNAGLNQQQAAQLFANLASKYGGTSVPQSNGAAGAQSGHGTGANGAGGDELASVFQPLLAPVLQEVQQLKATFESRLAADRNAAAAAEQQAIKQAWDAFAANPAHRFAKEVQNDVAWLLDQGKVPKTGNWAADFKTAYDMACRLHPEIHEAQIEMRLAADREARRKKEQEAAERAKAASRSVTGNRVPGTVIEQRAKGGGGHEDDIMADVEAAYNAAASAGA